VKFSSFAIAFIAQQIAQHISLIHI